MATSNECSTAWTNGYVAGYKSIKGMIPAVPARPAGIPSGVTNATDYFYKLGYAAGVQAAKR
jgi:hypothetical protein